MLRLSRQFTTALLWLAIALLPLRGGMAAAMPMAMAIGTGESHMLAIATSSSNASTLASEPCHPAPAAQAAGEAGDTYSGGTHTCSLCDLCNAATAAVAPAPLNLSALPADSPRADASHDFVCAVLDTPERPPRLLLA